MKKTTQIILLVLGVAFLSVGGILTPMVFADEKDGYKFASGEMAEIEANSVSDSASTAMVDFGYAAEDGRSYTNSFKYTNKSEQAVALKLSIAESDDENFKASDWLAFVGGKNYYEVAAGESVNVAIRMNIPAGVEKGASSYARILLEQSVLGDEATTKSEKSEVLAKITLQGDNMSYGAETSVSGGKFGLAQENKLRVKIVNTGKVGYASKVHVRWSPAFDTNNWTELDDQDVEQEVMPGKELATEATISTNAWGIFKTEASYNYVNTDGKIVSATSTQYFVCCPWWVIAALIGVIVIIVIITIVVKRKKREE